ncbi:hypothetical protein M3Y98_00937400 [Aphelenchoides besseyi]|nr:hypothetical protein M3Y98_00937400 [Aphelenchoides besseyi]KAI6194303.1 hypothetical protein M3Y96_01110700 [Aphelenchoides besseyi]
MKGVTVIFGPLLLFCGAIASDVRSVPSVHYAADLEDEDVLIRQLPETGDQVVPKMNAGSVSYFPSVYSDRERSPIRVQSPSLDARLISSERAHANAGLDENGYPTPRPRVDPNSRFLASRTNRASIEDEKFPSDLSVENRAESVLKPLNSNYEVKLNDDAEFVKSFDHVRSNESKQNSIVPANGQKEVVVEFSLDSDITEEESESMEDDDEGEKDGTKNEAKEVKPTENLKASDDEINRYIDEIDREYANRANPNTQVKDEVVDPILGLRKYVVASEVPPRVRRDAVPQSPGRVSNQHEGAGGISYNIDFEPAKAAKPQLSPRPKRDDSKRVSDRENEMVVEVAAAAAIISSESSEDSSIRDSNELVETHADHQLPGTFSETLHRTVKDQYEKANKLNSPASTEVKGIAQQNVDRIPHPALRPKTPNVLAIDPPVSSSVEDSEENSNETAGVLILEKTQILIGEEEKSGHVIITDSDVKIEQQSDHTADTSEKPLSHFWTTGFAFTVEFSPLTLLLCSVMLMLVLLVRAVVSCKKSQYQKELGGKSHYDVQSLDSKITNLP